MKGGSPGRSRLGINAGGTGQEGTTGRYQRSVGNAEYQEAGGVVDDDGYDKGTEPVEDADDARRAVLEGLSRLGALREAYDDAAR